MSVFDQVLPASFNGIPFKVTSHDYNTGQKTVVHTYPNKDVPYIEYLGKKNQVFNVSGYLAGDDCYIQRDILAAMCGSNPSKAFSGISSAISALGGPSIDIGAALGNSGILIHPDMGPIFCALLDATFMVNAHESRIVRIKLKFMATADPIIIQAFSGPLAFITTIDQVTTGITTAISSIGVVFSSVMATAKLVTGDVITAIKTTEQFAFNVLSFSTDPTMIFNSVTGLQDFIGSGYEISRYSVGNTNPNNQNPVLSTIPLNLPPQTMITTASQALLDQTVANRLTLETAATAVQAQASADPNDDAGLFLSLVQALTEALRAMANNPADQIRILASLSSYGGQTYSTTSAYGQAQQDMNDAVAGACRRAALFSLAYATSSFQPLSSNDALLMIDLVAPLFDEEIIIAGNNFDDDTMIALTALRAAVVTDLQTRGSQLPNLVIINEKANLPACVIAQKLYGNPVREKELVQRNNPICPLFFPLTFEALAF